MINIVIGDETVQLDNPEAVRALLGDLVQQSAEARSGLTRHTAENPGVTEEGTLDTLTQVLCMVAERDWRVDLGSMDLAREATIFAEDNAAKLLETMDGIYSFSVEDGRGAASGGVQIRIEYNGELPATLLVGKSEKTLLANSDDLYLHRDEHLMAKDTNVAGDERAVFDFVDHAVEPGKLYHYYALLADNMPRKFREDRYIEWAFITRSITPKQREDSATWARRRRDEVTAHQDLNEIQSRGQGRSSADQKKRLTIDEAIDAELEDMASDDYIRTALETKADERGFVGEEREQFILNAYRRWRESQGG